MEAEEEQVSMLQHYMDEDANDTLTSTNITTEECQQYQSVIIRLFQIWQNVTLEQATSRERESKWSSINCAHCLCHIVDHHLLKLNYFRRRLMEDLRLCQLLFSSLNPSCSPCRRVFIACLFCSYSFPIPMTHLH